MQKPYRTLTIAGSDSGGGAGIQADIKTFSALGCYAMTVITAITAQNTCEVTDIHPIPITTIKNQFTALANDIGFDSIKIGMLHDIETIQMISTLLKTTPYIPVILDPVMISKGGHQLLEDNAIDFLQNNLFTQTLLITPNIPEAERLTKKTLTSKVGIEAAAKQLCLGQAVLIKGGHTNTQTCDDCLYVRNENKCYWFSENKIKTSNNHGTGCTLSSAITAFIAQGYDLISSVKLAKAYLTKALQANVNLELGSGHGPVEHFHAWVKQEEHL